MHKNVAQYVRLYTVRRELVRDFFTRDTETDSTRVETHDARRKGLWVAEPNDSGQSGKRVAMSTVSVCRKRGGKAGAVGCGGSRCGCAFVLQHLFITTHAYYANKR